MIPGADKAAVLGELGIDGGEDGRPLVSFVGKFTDFKGIDVLLRAAARYEQTVPGIRTLLVGHGLAISELVEKRDSLMSLFYRITADQEPLVGAA